MNSLAQATRSGPNLPALFVSHGAPTLALDPGRTGRSWQMLAQRLPRPRAILVVSAHWETALPRVSAAQRPPTIHDFFGFPQALFEIEYPAPGAPDLAPRVKELLTDAGLSCTIEGDRGLDHGAWVPLLSMYPDADIPVTQLSIQPELDPRHHFRMGQALRPLAAEGVLILASGSLTHNLRDVRWQSVGERGEPYVEGFREWIAARIAGGAIEELLDYRSLAPDARRAHPTDDHLLPLFVALGAAPDARQSRRVDNGVTLGVLAMDAYEFATGVEAGAALTGAAAAVA